MHKWESKPIWKAKERGPGIRKWQDEWNWRPVALNSLSRKAGGNFTGKILNDDIYECGFCKGRGEKPRGTRCFICGGKGAVLVNPPAIICAYCKGSGEEKRRSNLTCTVCRGMGVIHIQEPVERCCHCRGTGAEPTNKLPCIVCHGSGVVTVKEEARRDSHLRPGLEWQEFKSQPDKEAEQSPNFQEFLVSQTAKQDKKKSFEETGWSQYKPWQREKNRKDPISLNMSAVRKLAMRLISKEWARILGKPRNSELYRLEGEASSWKRRKEEEERKKEEVRLKKLKERKK